MKFHGHLMSRFPGTFLVVGYLGAMCTCRPQNNWETWGCKLRRGGERADDSAGDSSVLTTIDDTMCNFNKESCNE